MRRLVLTVALLFIAMLAALTVSDVVHYGVTALDVLSVLILILFLTGIIGALRNPPKE
jgi:uncharacterized membrane protein